MEQAGLIWPVPPHKHDYYKLKLGFWINLICALDNIANGDGAQREAQATSIEDRMEWPDP